MIVLVLSLLCVRYNSMICLFRTIFVGYCFLAHLRSCVCVCACVFGPVLVCALSGRMCHIDEKVFIGTM